MKTKYIYLLWLIALLPIIILRDFTPDNELRYLSIVDEALANGSIFTFTNHGLIYADKPPLYFWLMMLGKIILNGHRMWFLSMLSFIPALITLMTMTKWMGMANKREVGTEDTVNENVPILMLMTSGLFIGLSIVVRMDMLMIMFITLSLYTFYKIYRGENKPIDSYLFPIYVFLALFSKGPVGILVPLVSTILFLAFTKKLHTFRKYWGWKSFIIILAGCAVWFTGVYLEGGNEYLNNLLVHQTVGRGVNSFHHKEPFYYYAISIWYLIAPWSLLTIGLVIAGLYKRKIQRELELFFAIIIFSTLVFLSVISSKLGVYLLPILPFVVFLSASQMKRFNIQSKWIKASIAFPALVFIFVLPVLVYLTKTNIISFLDLPLIYVSATIFSIIGVATMFLIYREKKTYKAICTMSWGILLSVFIAGFTMPQLNSQLGWRNLCAKAKELSIEKHTTDYNVFKISRAENMDVYLQKDVHEISKEVIVEGLLKDQLLLLPVKEVEKDTDIGTVIKSKEYYTIGEYMVVVL